MNESPIAPQQLIERAIAFERAGRLEAAIQTYRQLLDICPDLPECWYNLGVLERKLRRFDAALAAYDRALQLGIPQPEEVWLNRAVIFADFLYREHDAEQALKRALDCNATYAPALLNLANLYEDLGRRSEALACYEKLLKLHPDHHEALARYARLRPLDDAHDPLDARLRAVMVNHGATAADKASVGFALAYRLESTGAYAAAFEAFSQANRWSAASVPPGTPAYDPVAERAFVERLIEVFDGQRRLVDTTGQGVEPIFVCGMFRSGSTLAERVLSGHPRVRAGGEIDFFPRIASTRLVPFPAAAQAATDEELLSIGHGYREFLQQRFTGTDFVTDKRPDNFYYVGLIKLLFPRAKIVHTVRHPLDNCWSIFCLHLDPRVRYAQSLANIAAHYRAYRRLFAHWKSLYADDIFDLDYDRFVRAPRVVTQELLDFCGLAWNDRCLATDRADGAVKTASVWQVREPVHVRASGRWRHYAAELAPLRRELAEFLPDFLPD